MGVTQDKLVFRQTRTTCIHSYTHYCVYNQGALHTGGISGVFLVNLKKLVKCTIKKDNNKKKTYTFINQMQHLHACSSLMFRHSTVWLSSPETIHYFNQIVYAGCAAKSVKPKPAESELDSSAEEGSHSQCFEKANPSLST